MFIVQLTYTKPLIEIDKFGNEHLAFLSKYFKAEKFIVSGRQNPREGGVIIAYNITRTELNEILKEDPFYEHDLADYNIIEFVPVKYQETFLPFITK